nr:uncharacterized protein LOC129275281 [Lytechinus pictus]
MATLIEAAKAGNLTQVRRIVHGGRTDINCRDSEKKGTPLFWAANGGHDEIVTLLLNNGADIEIPVKFGMTPLLAAADRKHLTTVQLLLLQGANVNAQNQNGDTALHLAAYRGSGRLCTLLIEWGASRTFLNNIGKTAQQVAEAEQHRSINKLLAPETNHKAVCRSSSLPSAHLSSSAVKTTWREPKVASESDDSPFYENDEEWTSLQRKLAKAPLHQVMAIRRDGEVTRSYSAQQLDKVGRMSPPCNHQNIPHLRSPHLYPEDASRPSRRGSDPQTKRESTRKVVYGYDDFSGVLNHGKRWSPPLHKQHLETTPVMQYRDIPSQRDGHREFQESSGNGFSYRTNGQHEHSVPGYYRRDISSEYNIPLSTVRNGRDITRRLSPETPRSKKLGDEHRQHTGILANAGSAMANSGYKRHNSHVQWNPDVLSGHKNYEQNSQGSYTFSDQPNGHRSQHQRLTQDLGSEATGYGRQRTLGKNNLQNVERNIHDYPSEVQESEVRQLHSVIEKLIEDKLTLKEQNQVMGERLNRLESVLDAALAADTSSEESLQTSSDSDLVQALARQLDSNFGRRSRLEQLCLKLVNDNQRLHALAASSGRRDHYGIVSKDNSGYSEHPVYRRIGQTIPNRNPDLLPQHESEYSSTSSPSNQSTSSSSLSPLSDSSLTYDYGSCPDHVASSKEIPDQENSSFGRSSDMQKTLCTAFAAECWRSLNSSFPRVTFQSGNVASSVTKVGGIPLPSKNRTENIKRVLQAMCEDDKHLNSRGQYSTQLTDGERSDFSHSVTILEKLRPTSDSDSNILSHFKCLINNRLCILKVMKLSRVDYQDFDGDVEERIPPTTHLHLPFHHFDVPLPREGRFEQQLQVKLQDNLKRCMENVPRSREYHQGTQKAGHRPSGEARLHRDMDFHPPDKDVFRCKVYPFVMTLQELFSLGRDNGGEEARPCTDIGVVRILLQLLLAVEHLHREGVVHGNIHPGCVFVTEDMRIVLGGLEDARKFGGSDGKVPNISNTASGLQGVPSGQSSNESEDVFAIATTLCQLLGSGMGSSFSPAEVTDRNVTIPPDWLSRNLHSLLTEMLSSHPKDRPPVKSASLRTAAMLYGPGPDEVKSEVDCGEWLISQALHLIITAPRDQAASCPAGEPDCGDAVHRFDWGLCRDFILGVTPEKLWQLCQQHPKT